MIKLLRIGGLLVALAWVMPAIAQVQPAPFLLSQWVRSSGTIAVGGTAQNVAWTLGTAAMIRCVQNPVSASEDLFVDPSGAASTTLSFDLAPGALFCIGGGLVWNGSWSVLGATSAHAYIAFEGK